MKSENDYLLTISDGLLLYVVLLIRLPLVIQNKVRKMSQGSSHNDNDIQFSAAETIRCYSRLLRVVDTLIHKTEFFAKEFCKELHSEHNSLIECWRWVRELGHVIDVSIDPEDAWPSKAEVFVKELLLSKSKFVTNVHSSLLGGGNGRPGEFLLECGSPHAYNLNLDKQVYRDRLNAASGHAIHFLSTLRQKIELPLPPSENSDPDNG